VTLGTHPLDTPTEDGAGRKEKKDPAVLLRIDTERR